MHDPHAELGKEHVELEGILNFNPPFSNSKMVFAGRLSKGKLEGPRC